MIGYYLKDDQFTKNTAKILQRLKTDSDDKAEALAMRIATKVEITRWTVE
jgi:hypothetical protein